MSDQYLGEIRSFGFNFAPVGWLQCSGQLLSITQYTALFSLLGTSFGGNGTSNFGLPNLVGNVPMHWGASSSGSTYYIGDINGATTQTINSNQLPLHNHQLQVADSGVLATATPDPTTWLGIGTQAKPYVTSGAFNTTMSQSMIGPNPGGSQPHENMQPYLTINFCIALTGAYPPRG
jgi:microcystin-dependent protein